MAPANDNAHAANDYEGAIDDPIGHFPWLSSEAAGKARGIIMQAIQRHLAPSGDDAAGLSAWILEDLAVAGFKVVRRD